jgi:hypothetical protein
MIIGLLVILTLSLTGCDLMNTVKSVVPKFSAEHPNLLIGEYVVKTDGGSHYLHDLVLSKDLSYSHKGQDGTETKGTYSITYNHLDLLQASGEITFSNGFSGTKATMAFSFTADVDNGPHSLILDGTAYTFVKR